MKKLLFLTIFLTSAIWSYGQTTKWVWPDVLRAFNQTTGAPGIRETAKYAADRVGDSITKVFDAKLKALEASFNKKLKDSMASLIPADGKTIVVKDGKFTAVGGGTTDLTPFYDTIAKLDAKLTASNLLIANNLNSLTTRVTTLEGKVTALESWRVTITAQLITINSSIANLNTEIGLLKTQVQNIPKGVQLTY